jgi:predicted ATP-dependent endonuclease of OLD family
VRISGLAITNHSRIPTLALAVRQHAVIVGANDVGKSSILRLLNLTLGASTAALYQRLSKSDLAEADSPLVVDVTLAVTRACSRRRDAAAVAAVRRWHPASSWCRSNSLHGRASSARCQQSLLR